MLGSRVGPVGADRNRPGHGGYVHDRSRAPPLEERHERPDAPHARQVVRVGDGLDPLGLELQKCAPGANPGAVDKEPDRFVPLTNARGEIVHLRPVCDVARLELAVNLRGDALQPLPAAGDENASPLSLGQAPREGGADAARSTRDHRDRNARSVDCGAVTQDFQGKRGLVLGVANRRSIAWAIAQRLAAGGAQLAFTYQGERIEKGVRELADSVGSPLVTECDVRSDDEVTRVLGEVGEAFGGELDLLVHSVAFADARDLEGRFTDTPRDRFWLALDVSAYSLVAAARAAEPLMEAAGGGSILTMTYLGGERAVPHYNVMGVAKAALDASVRYLAWELGEKQIRVNAVSAGPVRTLAARSIAGFPTMEAIVEERSPLRRNIEADDVGSAAAYLLSDEAKNVSGTTLYVDGGYHAMGM